jgi:hypothetical protein
MYLGIIPTWARWLGAVITRQCDEFSIGPHWFVRGRGSDWTPDCTGLHWTPDNTGHTLDTHWTSLSGSAAMYGDVLKPITCPTTVYTPLSSRQQLGRVLYCTVLYCKFREVCSAMGNHWKSAVAANNTSRSERNSVALSSPVTRTKPTCTYLPSAADGGVVI